MKKVIVFLAVAYLIVLLVIVLCMKMHPDTWWPLTLFLLAPRWVVALPMIVLVPLTVWFHPRWLASSVIQGAIIWFAILGYQQSAKQSVATAVPTLTVLTCNLGGGAVDLDALIQLIHTHDVQVVLLQECPRSVSTPLLVALGWNHRQQSGIAIGSPFELGSPQVLGRHSEEHYRSAAAVACDAQLPDGEAIQLVSVHLPTFRPAFEVMLETKMRRGRAEMIEMGLYYRDVVERVREALQPQDLPTIIGGDFNVPVESAFYRDHWHEWNNTFSIAGQGFGYTKHTRFHAVKIDHLLVNDKWGVADSFVGLGLGGDHRPVIARLVRASRP